MKLFKSGRPKPPPAEVAAANAGGWVYDIDADWVDDPNGYVPPEAIRGGWRVDDAGKLTGEFVANAKHSAPRDDLSRLTSPDHWLGWLGDNPGRRVRDLIEEELAGQVAGARIEWLKFLAEPKVVTSTAPVPGEPNKRQMLEAALAVQFAVSVKPPRGSRDLVLGVFTLAIAGMADPVTARQQAWFDPGVTAEPTEALLEERLRQLS